MNSIYIPLFSALLGAILGSATSLITLMIQTRTQNRRELMKLAGEISLREYEHMMDHAIRSGKTGIIPPIGLYIDYNMRLLELMAGNKLNSDNLRSIREKNRELAQQLKESGIPSV